MVPLNRVVPLHQRSIETRSVMSTLRPAGSGRPAEAAPFLRATATPRAALVIRSSEAAPSDWPTVSGVDATDANLGHALGWTCEIRAADVVLLNPLGEGTLKAALPALDQAWVANVRSSSSAAVYLLLESEAPGDLSEASVSEAAARNAIVAASVRTAISEKVGASPPVGRNDPCPCDSGRKFKHCHGR